MFPINWDYGDAEIQKKRRGNSVFRKTFLVPRRAWCSVLWEAVLTVYWSAFGGFERDLALFSAVGADGFSHFAGRIVVSSRSAK